MARELDEVDVVNGVDTVLYRMNRIFPKIHDGILVLVAIPHIVYRLLGQGKTIGLVVLFRRPSGNVDSKLRV